MKRLTQECFQRARSFVEKVGREVDRRMLAFDLGEGSADDVVDALSAYQNSDGGFGRALEGDLRADVSSVITTTVAFQYLRRVGAPSDNATVRRGIQYLLDTYDEGSGVWPIIPPEVCNAPHAPWWNYDGIEERFEGFKLNPAAEALGYLLDYPNDVPATLLTVLTETVLARIDSKQDKLDMFDLACSIRLAETASLPENARATLIPRIEAAADNVVDRNPEKWSSFSAKPVSLAESPESLLAPTLDADIQRNLDYEIDHQGADGAWIPYWTWEGDAWQQAERDWKGHLTVNMLRTLRAFDRIG
jgi:hypothetical protein